MEGTEKVEYLLKELSCDWQKTKGRDSEAVRSRFTTQRKHAEFLGYKQNSFCLQRIGLEVLMKVASRAER